LSFFKPFSPRKSFSPSPSPLPFGYSPRIFDFRSFFLAFSKLCSRPPPFPAILPFQLPGLFFFRSAHFLFIKTYPSLPALGTDRFPSLFLPLRPCMRKDKDTFSLSIWPGLSLSSPLANLPLLGGKRHSSLPFPF